MLTTLHVVSIHRVCSLFLQLGSYHVLLKLGKEGNEAEFTSKVAPSELRAEPIGANE